ncbi:sigma-70 family RNA polymerase sigma factor [Sinorhizobium sp. A49]|uniref:RNA polymerase sigma factor n=1 Tax=Sinorhizobium sp. A49 TaxID=1945861 RepID=UPI0009871246|nr:sigma-70 family RNA polymerase sigma factor [Sinorhizobium sp. A49]
MSEKSASHLMLDDAIVTYYDELCVMTRQCGHASATANDVVHELYVRLVDRRTSLEGKSSLRAFLRRACTNLGIDRLRRDRFELKLFSGSEEEALGVASNIAAPDANIDLRRRLSILKTAIMEMSLQRRRVFLANRIGNLSSDEIALRTGISRNMVDRHLRKAYLHCLDRLEDAI